MARPKKTANNYLSRIETEIQSNQSKLNMILGALIVLVVGILVFNYFNRSKPALGPAQNTTPEGGDVSPDNLPGKYTVKEGDTLFTIADKYYQDGYKFEEIAKANNMTDPNNLETGQILEIPKLGASAPSVTPSPTPTPEATSQPEEMSAPPVSETPSMDTNWGPKISGTSYTVVEGDWLSKIAGRAYGDIFAYKKLAEVNHIPNPDLIEPGMVLVIPR